MNTNTLDHLFRHQYGKMVSIFSRIFGLEHLSTIEDAVQDTFYKATLSWRISGMPDNPEAWLNRAAKNRIIDLFRKIKSEKNRHLKFDHGPSVIALQEIFLDSEIEDAQLRMIFTACHPKLSPIDQITFALKTVSGFSTKEIASALLKKEDAIKKRYVRARKSIVENKIPFKIPMGSELLHRIKRVHEVIYLIFNEGFQSNNKDVLVRKELCAEAMRLCSILMQKKLGDLSTTQALFALMCFHSARLESKVSAQNEIISLEFQDRTKWYLPLITMGNDFMFKAVESQFFSIYHYEAAIVAEHLKAKTFTDTDWSAILGWYQKLLKKQPNEFIRLNMAIVFLQLNEFSKAKEILDQLNEGLLQGRNYLLDATWAEYYLKKALFSEAKIHLKKAIKAVGNQSEKRFLEKKLHAI